MTGKKDGRSTNSNKAIQEKKEYWDSQMPEIKRLVTMNGFRMKDLAKHFDCTASSIATVLHRRGISLVGLRHNFAKEQRRMNYAELLAVSDKHKPITRQR